MTRPDQRDAGLVIARLPAFPGTVVLLRCRPAQPHKQLSWLIWWLAAYDLTTRVEIAELAQHLTPVNVRVAPGAVPRRVLDWMTVTLGPSTTVGQRTVIPGDGTPSWLVAVPYATTAATTAPAEPAPPARAGRPDREAPGAL